MSFGNASFSIGLTICLLAGAHAAPQAQVSARPASAAASTPPAPPLSAEARMAKGENAIAPLLVERADDGSYWVTVHYHYTGSPKGARLEVGYIASRAEVPVEADHTVYTLGYPELIEGTQRLRFRMQRPDEPLHRYTQGIYASMRDPRHRTFEHSSLTKLIKWPATVQALPSETVLKEAISHIDSDDPDALELAKIQLERLVARDPKQDQAYLELARVAMKTNWSPEGLRAAEALIKSAQQLRPDSVNAKILLGYVYVNQGRDKEGLALFEQAARAGTSNLWLHVNWGELLAKQGKQGPAIEKFREALKVKPTGDANDRARRHAYTNLLRVYRNTGDLDAIEAVHRQRWAEYPEFVCHGTAYAYFMVSMRGDPGAANAITKTLPAGNCKSSEARMLPNLVRYVNWSITKGDGRDEALRAARVAMPVSPQLFKVLAESDQTLAVARQLVAVGEKVAMQDNQRMDALTYALASGDIAAARRLIAIGARTDALVGAEQMPVALVPVLNADVAGIALMQKSGVDYAKLRFRGATALDWARQQGDEQVLNALKPGSKGL
jgi:tetratricopeptide (TPR) repeat protein